jgi:type VI secretion system protein ImpJ
MNVPLPRKPIWPESGGIPPQHRQFPDAYAEDLTAFTLDAVAPYSWGVSRIDLDESALARGVVRVVTLQGRFASGLPAVLWPQETLERKLVQEHGASCVNVSLGVPRASDDSPNVGDNVDGGAVRYRRVAFDGASVLRPNLRILFGDEGGALYERLPVARVVLSSGRAELAPWCLPPLLRIYPESHVADAVRQIVASLALRQAHLLAALAARPLDLGAFAPGRAPQLLLLSAINQALALLDHADPWAHLSPQALHEALGELLGSLESMCGRGEGPVPSYVHLDPGPGFRTLVGRLLALIPSVARDPHLAFPLERRDAWTFALTLREPELFRRRAYLVASGADERVLSAHLPAHAKIASAAWLPNLVQSAMRGVPIATEFDPPPSLPSSANHCCFKIDTRSELWTDVIQQGSLMVHVPEAPNGLSLTAYVLPGERS